MADEPRYTASEWAQFHEMQRSLPAQGAAAGDATAGDSAAVSGAEPAPAEAPPETRMVVYWANLLSMRLWIAALLGAALLTWLCNYVLPDAVAGWLFWVFFAALAFGGLFGEALDCPRCGKNVKMGYSRCHHCQYDIPVYR